MIKEKSEFLEWLKAGVLAALFVIAIRTFIFTPLVVDGASMMPTYADGDKVIVSKLGNSIEDFERFDIIVFEYAEHTNYIKRIIGLPGEHVAYKDDTLYINGEKYEEPYLDLYKSELLDPGTLTEDFTLEELTDHSTIPDGYFLVLGDNRRKSTDSRDARVGLISIDQIMGKATIRFYPFDHIGRVK
ncbi:MAG: signal peptidase I [Solibacillus sp.]|uniref:signal peptidase I n=1 Tax=unclassified Solibacillus TaxID=2637870 RepID=UPI0030F53842